MRGPTGTVTAGMKLSHLMSTWWIALLASTLLKAMTVVCQTPMLPGHCKTLKTECRNVDAQVISVFPTNETNPMLMCAPSTQGNFVWYHSMSSIGEGTPIDSSRTDKYMFSGTNNAMLTINYVDVSDEGIYFCNPSEVIAACLDVFVPAKFENCPRGQKTHRKGCLEVTNLQATTDSSVDFDLSLAYDNVSNACNYQQILSVEFTGKDSSLSIRCNNETCITETFPRLNVTRKPGNTGFNIVMTLFNLTISDSGIYSVRAELQEAGEEARFCVYKNFTLSVTEPTTTPPSETASTTMNTVSSSAMSDSVVIAITVVSVVLFIPLVVLIVMVVILCLWTCYRRRQETGKAAIYERPDQAKSGFKFLFFRRRKGGSSMHQLSLDQNGGDNASLHSRNEADGVGELNPTFNREGSVQV